VTERLGSLVGYKCSQIFNDVVPYTESRPRPRSTVVLGKMIRVSLQVGCHVFVSLCLLCVAPTVVWLS
jgi:hypothetical protein